MRIVTLGTGSGKPTLARTVSAVAAIWEEEWLLFDCGEGTQVQIMKARLHPNRLAAIFITHLHGDHFNGLPGFLSTMGLDRRDRPLVLIGPPGMRRYVELLGELKVLFVNYPLEIREFGQDSFAPEGSGVRRPAAPRPSSQDQMIAVYQTPKLTVWSRPLLHRIFALGYRIEEAARPGRFDIDRARQLGIPAGPLFGKLQSGQSITLADGRTISSVDVMGPARPGKTVAYCTDTRPCPAGVHLGSKADLLIHEATYAGDLVEEARAYGHSTADQAAEVARQAEASRLLLTHISPRYHDASCILDGARAIFPASDLAADLMEMDIT